MGIVLTVSEIFVVVVVILFYFIATHHCGAFIRLTFISPIQYIHSLTHSV